jgi:hypothetical protein
MHFSSPPYMPHVLPISVFFTWSPKWYLVRSAEHEMLALKVLITFLAIRNFLSFYLHARNWFQTYHRSSKRHALTYCHCTPEYTVIPFTSFQNISSALRSVIDHFVRNIWLRHWEVRGRLTFVTNSLKSLYIPSTIINMKNILEAFSE